jgi:microcompartment protein CcmL/EutN
VRPSFDDLDRGAAAAGEALALLECSGIADGYGAGDRALKAAEVHLLLCRPVSPGKFLVLFAGAPAAVVPALRAAQEGLTGPALDTLLLPKVEGAILAALAGANPARGEPAGGADPGAIGSAACIIECATVATLLAACDVALKSAAVRLQQLRAAVGIGGKAFFVLRGAIDQVECAAAAASGFASAQGRSVETTLLSQPDRLLERWLDGGDP